MATQLTAADAKQSLTDHVIAKGVEILVKYGPQIGWRELQHLLEDRAYVRYPCKITFDAALLQAGEFAHPEQKGERPEDGFTMFVHPLYQTQLDRVPALVLYQLVALNYGEFASSDDAENFGAAALGLTRDEYYALLCECADQLGSNVETGPVVDESSHTGCCSGGGCSCG